MRLEEIQLITADPHIEEEASASLDQIERLVGVVDDLLKSSRKTDGGSTEAVVLKEIFEQQATEWEPSFQRAERELEFTDPGATEVLATPGALSQVIATLLENSLKYGAGRTTVQVRDPKLGGDAGVVIEVTDEGEGINDDIAPYIFERHVTGGGGTGLGLAVARDLIAADGGRLELAQRTPATFAIFLSAVPPRLGRRLPPGLDGRRRAPAPAPINEKPLTNLSFSVKAGGLGTDETKGMAGSARCARGARGCVVRRGSARGYRPARPGPRRRHHARACPGPVATAGRVPLAVRKFP